MWLLDWLIARYNALVDYLDTWHTWAGILFRDYIWAIRRYVVYWQTQINTLVNTYWSMIESFFGNRWNAFWKICVTLYATLVWYAETAYSAAQSYFGGWYNYLRRYVVDWSGKIDLLVNQWWSNAEQILVIQIAKIWRICVTLYTILVWYAETAYGAAQSYFGGWYNYLRTYVVDWTAYISVLIGSYWNKVESFFGNRWNAFWQVCVTWYAYIQVLVTAWYDRLGQLSGHMFDRLAALSFQWFDRLIDLLQNRYDALLLLLQNPTGALWDSLQDNLWDWLEWWFAYLIDGTPTNPPNRR